jgi:hypothetical protein
MRKFVILLAAEGRLSLSKYYVHVSGLCLPPIKTDRHQLTGKKKLSMAKKKK